MSAGLLPSLQARIGRRHLVDRLVRILVRLGGVAVVGSILAIFFVLLVEVFPLFRRAKATPGPIGQAARVLVPLRIAADEHLEVACVLHAGGFEALALEDGRELEISALPLDGAHVTASSELDRGAGAVALSDGRIVPFEISYTDSWQGGKRSTRPTIRVGESVPADPEGRGVVAMVSRGGEDKTAIAMLLEGGVVRYVKIVDVAPMTGPKRREVTERSWPIRAEGRGTAIAIDNRTIALCVGTSAGEVVRWDLRRTSSEPEEVIRVGDAPVTALAFLKGEQTLVVADGKGAVSGWQVVKGGDKRRVLVRTREFEPHGASVIALAPSHRDRLFVSADASGQALLRYGTTGETRVAFRPAEARLVAVTFAPKGDAVVALDDRGRVAVTRVDDPHPDATWRSLFGKVWYEGYPGPTYSWQSSSGSDDFEAKLSLVPLVVGTLKGTFYALLIAVPISLLGALYASQFLHPRLRGIVKPCVEIMAALPSVVLGFIAGLWLAPAVEKFVPGIFLMPVVVALVILAAVVGWRQLPERTRHSVPAGFETFLLLPLVALAAWCALRLGVAIEAGWLGGNCQAWLKSVCGITYDQRNSLVVGFAMGFAVIPIMFTIAEDSLSNVPRHLVAGALALGATRWEAATRVVLPTASPGIFSAVMIGFGRAVGETMIVLMATGNTPVMDASIFSGFRALSANIAVELPEAAYDTTHFRVLFVAALLLFAMTFAVNTVAEVVRLRLRKRYALL